MILTADRKIFGLIKPLIFPLRNNRTKFWFQIIEAIYHIYYNEDENQLDNFMIYREFVISLQNCKLVRSSRLSLVPENYNALEITHKSCLITFHTGMTSIVNMPTPFTLIE